LSQFPLNRLDQDLALLVNPVLGVEERSPFLVTLGFKGFNLLLANQFLFKLLISLLAWV
jgi:hypothetical protein